uniref:25S rRNA (uridine-N(3))-methyltransferase BMT5-like domain-containing protein n=1 Tax=Chromera velia CCMP2878 TaxID=1169474 RepID=A0A0G4IB23_9ALVE|eukprot:Cvel_12627.t1-p1 / transcript=Cvel_12627.t1 / gene=Cvel_12627 / organism=Chromera_velia_CCMP2878 / gene_product=UPF0617 protein C1919.13c, putative / transcript_product=UPF0617 protein C1919.13c, putative / location=Cvel_scaffold833:34131-38497(+) / protein_length=373 / sequence_SO=supercontig / SO=protein_coding / is_pseudo=false
MLAAELLCANREVRINQPHRCGGKTRRGRPAPNSLEAVFFTMGKAKKKSGLKSLFGKFEKQRKVIEKHKAKEQRLQEKAAGVPSSSVPASSSAAASAKQKQNRGPSLKGAYSEGQRILLVGEGNFSFAHALCEKFGGNGGGITATAYDDGETVLSKYPDAKEHLGAVREAGGDVRFSVDGTRLGETLGALSGRLKRKKKKNKDKEKGGGDGEEEGGEGGFDVIAFHFPHVGLGIKDQDENVRANQKLLGGFFRSCMDVLGSQGEVHVTVKTGKPYDLWKVCAVAKEATEGELELKTAFHFDPSDFPPYEHRRTLGFQEGFSKEGNEEISGRGKQGGAGAPRTYCWRRKGAKASSAKRQLRKGGTDGDDDDLLD